MSKAIQNQSNKKVSWRWVLIIIRMATIMIIVSLFSFYTIFTTRNFIEKAAIVVLGLSGIFLAVFARRLIKLSGENYWDKEISKIKNKN